MTNLTKSAESQAELAEPLRRKKSLFRNMADLQAEQKAMMAMDGEEDTPEELAADKVQAKALETEDAALMMVCVAKNSRELNKCKSVTIRAWAKLAGMKGLSQLGKPALIKRIAVFRNFPDVQELPMQNPRPYNKATRRETLKIIGAVDDEDDDDDEDENEEDGEAEEDQLKEVGETGDQDGHLTWSQQEQATRANVTQYINARRRKGGLSTDKHCGRQIEEFTELALAEGKIQDDLVDQHFIAEFMMYSSKRPKMTTKRVPQPGTRVGSQSLRKLFFGCIRYRKMQAANDPKYDKALDQTRPAVNDNLAKFLQMVMYQATHDLRMGNIPAADAQDVRAGTVLDSLTVEEEDKLGWGFLAHPKLHMAVKGHMIWTLQRSTGMRGDDLRAMHLAALQPYSMTLPNDFSNREVPALVLLQWSHKTVHTTNIEHPKFHTVITHKRPDLDAQAGLGFYLHWLFDVFQIEEKHEFDWTLNKSWRHLRLIFGSSCGSEYSEGSLYNLFSLSYATANVPIKHKSSLQRHLLGKHHEGQGVAQSETERMGWASGVYAKHYANPIPKQAVLGSAGFHRAEKYDPVWLDKVTAPEHLTRKLFPQAEDRIRLIEDAIAKGNSQLRGARDFWKLVAGLRPRILLAGACIRQQLPHSALFRLPIFQDPEVIDWMQNVFPAEMEEANRGAGQVNLENVQSEIVAEALYATNARLDIIQQDIAALKEVMFRRTQLLTPSKGIGGVVFTGYAEGESPTPVRRHPGPVSPSHRRLFVNDDTGLSSPLPSTPAASGFRSISESLDPGVAIPSIALPSSAGQAVDAIADILLQEEGGGTYEDENGNMRAYALSSPKDPTKRRPKTELDMYLPKELETWAVPGQTGSFQLPPFLGIKGVSWEVVFPSFLWSVWKPKDLGSYATLRSVWTDWDRVRSDGSGVRPPLKEIEARWKAKWRSTDAARQLWSKFLTLAMFCHERINVQKQEWSDVQKYLDTQPYLLPKGQPDPQKRTLSQIGIPQLGVYLKEQKGLKKPRNGKGKGNGVQVDDVEPDDGGEGGSANVPDMTGQALDLPSFDVDPYSTTYSPSLDRALSNNLFRPTPALPSQTDLENPVVTPMKRPGGPDGPCHTMDARPVIDPNL